MKDPMQKFSGMLLLLIGSFFNGYAADKWTHHRIDSTDFCMAIAIEKEMAWLGTQSEGVMILDLNCAVLDTYTTEDGLADNWVTAIAIDEQGNKWFGTNYGISKFDGVTWTTYNVTNGLAQRNVKDIEVDKQGNKWIATAGGVSKFDGTTWTTFTIANGLANNYICAIAIDKKNNKWFGTCNIDGSGVSKFDDAVWTTYTTDNGLAHNAIASIACDDQNNKWFGTFDGHVSKYNDTLWKTYDIATELNQYVSSIAVDGLGNVWFALQWVAGGAVKFNGNIIKKYTMADGLLNDYVLAVAIDSFGNKWFGTRGGVSKLEENIIPIIARAPKRENPLTLYPISAMQNYRATLRFSLPKTFRMKLSVFDLNGKCIRVLYDGIKESGDHLVNWDGKQSNGRFAGAGCYVVKLEAAAKLVSCRILLAK